MEIIQKELEGILSYFSNLKLRSDRISVEILDEMEVTVDKKTKKKLKELTSFKLIDNGKKIVVIPHEKKNSDKIIKTIIEYDMGYSLLENNKETIIFTISPLTTEIKKKIINKLNDYHEETKSKIKQIRQKYKNKIKKEENSENKRKISEKQLEKTIEEYQKKLMDIREKKIKNYA